MLAILPISYVLFYSFKMFVMYLTVASTYVTWKLGHELTSHPGEHYQL